MCPDKNCYELIKNFEGLKLHAYLDSVGVCTIGYGSILYRNNQPIHMGDIITEAIAEELLEWEVTKKSTTVDGATKYLTLTQNQFNALTSFAYNAGIGALLSSTVVDFFVTSHSRRSSAIASVIISPSWIG